eukprot:scaffold15.g4285.t1
MASVAVPSDVDAALGTNTSLLTSQDRALVTSLLAEGQAHLFAHWPPLGERDADKRRALDQLAHLDRSYAGGLVKYIANAQRLLRESKEGMNPFEGCTPSVPEGEKLDFGSTAFREFERRGVEASAWRLSDAGDAAFVLVAGGLGERLGYSGIKVALPLESASGTCFLQHYVESILALQAKAQARRPGRKLPLAIMTSDDTHQRTVDLLEARAYFGAERDQIILIKQEKGFKWICFFQDTNGLVFKALPAAIGVSAAHGYDVNSLAVPRKAKEAIGAITRLTFAGGRSITMNVEYNQLDPLLRATINPEGDVNDASGFSPLPGEGSRVVHGAAPRTPRNINQLVMKLESYCAELARHGGVIGEFVNPKYADASKTAFKSSTRLECMMQDFPQGLPDSARVGFTVVNQARLFSLLFAVCNGWAAYSPVKNSPADAAAKAAAGNPSHSATTGELDVYHAHCAMLEIVGARVGAPRPAEFNGIRGLQLWPRVAWSPLWAACFDDLEAKVAGAGVSIGSDAALVIAAPGARLQSLELARGALVLEGAAGAEVVVDSLRVDNAGWRWEALDPDAGAAEEEYIRGFRVVRQEQKVLKFDSPGNYRVGPDA